MPRVLRIGGLGTHVSAFQGVQVVSGQAATLRGARKIAAAAGNVIQTGQTSTGTKTTASGGGTSPSLLSDWTYRSNIGALSGGWGQLFTKSSDVNNYRFTNGVGWDPSPAGGSVGSFVRLGSGLGVMGNGCLELEQMTNGNMNAYWQRPFNPAIPNWQISGAGGEHGPGQGFYFQLAFRTNCEGQAGVGGGGRKHWSATLMRSSYTFQELVVYDDNYRGVLQMYQGLGPLGNQFEPLLTTVPPSDFNLQPGSQYTQGVGAGYCSYQAISGSGNRSNCWIPADEWQWYLYHIIPSTAGGTNGYISIDVWKAGMPNYVRILERTNQYMQYESTAQFFDSMLLWIYETGRTSGPANQKQWYDQAIFSNQWIPPPTAGTSLGQLAVQMPANSWASFSTTNLITSPITSTSGMWLMATSNGVDGIGADSNQMAWDPLHQRVHFVGQFHGNVGFGLRHVYYDCLTNAWTTVGHFAQMGADDGGHGLASICCDPNTGDVYFRRYGNTAPTAKFTYATQTWNMSYATMPSATNNSPSVVFWSGPLAGVTGGKGAVVHHDAQFGHCEVFDVGTGTWVDTQPFPAIQPPISGTGYDEVAAYNRISNTGFFGNGFNPSPLGMKMDANKTVTVLPNFPNGNTISIRDGTLCEHPTIGGAFLSIAADGHLWKYTDAGVYSDLGPIPAGVNRAPQGLSNFVTVVAIPEYGVMMAVSTTSSTGTCFIYKP